MDRELLYTSTDAFGNPKDIRVDNRQYEIGDIPYDDLVSKMYGDDSGNVFKGYVEHLKKEVKFKEEVSALSALFDDILKAKVIEFRENTIKARQEYMDKITQGG